MVSVRYFWNSFIQRGTTFMYLQYSRPRLFITFRQMSGRLRSPSAIPSLLMFLIDCLIAWISSYLVLYRVHRSGSFTLAKGTQSHGLKRKRHHLLVQWQSKEPYRCCHGSLAPLAMEDSGTSTLLSLHESIRLRSLRQSERTTARDTVQHKIWTYP